jgi:DNA repair protein RadC
VESKENKITWKHPGGKLRRLGPQFCSEADLLAIILHSGANGRSAIDIASELIEKFGGLSGIKGKTLKELMKTKGLKATKATQIAAVYEITRRLLKDLERSL